MAKRASSGKQTSTQAKPKSEGLPRRHLTRQLEIIHLSDIHFGKRHRFQPLEGPSSTGKSSGFPSLVEKLETELAERTHDSPTIVCITGDFATGDIVENTLRAEFDQAADFVKSLLKSKVNGKKIARNQLFVVPGNHDIEFKETNPAHKWEQWAQFYREATSRKCKDDNPYSFVTIDDRIDDLGCVIACLNSTMYVQYGSDEAHRGALDPHQLVVLESQLKAIDPGRLQSAIKICLVHHHPILIPFLAEPKRGYDAVQYGDQLVRILREHRFHLLLHGHKHTPHVFSEDCRRAFIRDKGEGDQPMLVVAGGSVGSTELEPKPHSTNCYNRITVKWHSAAQTARIRVVTRGLVRFNDGGDELLPQNWTWETLIEDDRNLKAHQRISPACNATTVDKDWAYADRAEELRIGEYKRLRGNMAVIQTRPSLVPDQAYEARFWIVEHTSDRLKMLGIKRELPKFVIWSAGKLFTPIRIDRERDPAFLGTFDYWDGMLVQACLEFDDGAVEYCFAYAHVP